MIRTISQLLGLFLLLLSTVTLADELNCTGKFKGEYEQQRGNIPQGTKFEVDISLTSQNLADIAVDDPYYALYAFDKDVSSISISVGIYGTLKKSIAHVSVRRGRPGEGYSLVTFEPSISPSDVQGEIDGKKNLNINHLLPRFRHDISHLDTDQFPIKEKLDTFEYKWIPMEGYKLQIDTAQLTCTSTNIPPPPSPPCDFNTATHNITAYGAIPNDSKDDHAAIARATHCASHGDTIVIPSGLFHSSDTITVYNKALSIEGEGIRSGIYLTDTSKNLFDFNDITAMHMKNLFLGTSTAKEADEGALINLTSTRYSRFDNVQLQGGAYGLKMIGSLSNSFYNLSSGVNIVQPFDACPNDNCQTRQWVSIEHNARYSSNANRFYNVQLEGGQNGIKFDQTGRGGEGSFSLYGGIISVARDPVSGNPGKAIEIIHNGHPINISGMHIESGNVYLKAATHVTIDNSLIVGSNSDCEAGGAVYIQHTVNDNNKKIASRNTVISNSVVDRLISIGELSTRTVLMNIQQGFTKPNCLPEIVDKAKDKSDTLYINVSQNSAEKTKSSIGFGKVNPTVSNPDNIRIEIQGKLKENP